MALSAIQLTKRGIKNSNGGEDLRQRRKGVGQNFKKLE